MAHRAFLLVPLVLAVACGAPSASVEVDTLLQGLSPSSRPGMGATLYPGGASFRVWAPYARRVWVSGEFNGWGRTELANEHNGNFSVDVAGAGKHQRYRYVLENAWGAEQWRADPRSARMTQSDGDSIIHDPSSYAWQTHGFSTPSFDEQVIYELHVGTFHDSPGFGPGNWHSAVAKLDYLRDLGVNMVEVMPVAEFAGDFSWGYNPSAPFAPESAYGTPDDMKYFVDQAHARGIGVIFDIVHNHWGPSDLPMWCFSGDCLGHGGEYFYTDGRSKTPWGHTRPDYGRREVRDYIRDNVRMYLDEYRADGLRWDATQYIRKVDGDLSGASGTGLPEGWELLGGINGELERSQPWKRSIAEDFIAGDAITRPARDGGAGFHAQWTGNFAHPVRSAIIPSDDGARRMWEVRDAIVQRYNGRGIERVIYTENHDEVANGRSRVPEEIAPGNASTWAARKRSTLGAALVLTAPGTPLLFQGQEFLERGFFEDTRPLDWSRAGSFSGITQLYRDLIRLRRNLTGQTRGLVGDHVTVHHVNDMDKVIAYHRWKNGGPGDDVVVLANFSGRTFTNYRIGLPRPGRWTVRFNSDWNGYSSDFGNTATFDADAAGPGIDGMSYSAQFAIGPYSVVILSQ